MDIEANLDEMRNLVNEVNREWDERCASDVEPNPDTHVYRMAELFAAMDEWLSKGGSRPRAWR